MPDPRLIARQEASDAAMRDEIATLRADLAAARARAPDPDDLLLVTNYIFGGSDGTDERWSTIREAARRLMRAALPTPPEQEGTE